MVIYVISNGVNSFNITVTSRWARWCLKSTPSPLFIHPFVQAQIIDIKPPHHWPLCGECFHLMTSSWKKIKRVWRLFHIHFSNVAKSNNPNAYEICVYMHISSKRVLEYYHSSSVVWATTSYFQVATLETAAENIRETKTPCWKFNLDTCLVSETGQMRSKSLNSQRTFALYTFRKYLQTY